MSGQSDIVAQAAAQAAAPDSMTDSFEKAFSALPGGNRAVIRGAYGFGIGYLFMEAFKPTFAYNPDGSKRPWVFFSRDEQPGATYIAWWMPPAGLAIAFGMFV